ncbi:meiotic cell cortex C-terminal pleckstrin homology-domain-containing protein, partial [Thamnocephalis sphaerospora]
VEKVVYVVADADNVAERLRAEPPTSCAQCGKPAEVCVTVAPTTERARELALEHMASSTGESLLDGNADASAVAKSAALPLPPTVESCVAFTQTEPYAGVNVGLQTEATDAAAVRAVPLASLPSWKQSAATPDINNRDSTFMWVRNGDYDAVEAVRRPRPDSLRIPESPSTPTSNKRESHISMISGIKQRSMTCDQPLPEGMQSPTVTVSKAASAEEEIAPAVAIEATSPSNTSPQPRSVSPQPRRRITSFTGNRKTSVIELSDRDSVLIDGDGEGKLTEISPSPWEASIMSPTIQNAINDSATTATQTDADLFMEYAKSAVAAHLGVDTLQPPPRPTTGPPAALLARSATRNQAAQSRALVNADAINRMASMQSIRQNSGEEQTSLVPAANALRPVAPRVHGTSTVTEATLNSARANASGAPASMGGWNTSYGEAYGTRRQLISQPSPTDPLVIQSITQAMIGEYLYKFTSRPIMGGVSERKHRRFFWVHPYTKTIYWSTKAPGADARTFSRSVATAKSAYIKSVRVFLEANHTDSLASYYLVISTPKRELKIKADNDDRHHLWLRALSYLQSRASSTTPAQTAATVRRNNRWSMVEQNARWEDHAPGAAGAAPAAGLIGASGDQNASASASATTQPARSSWYVAPSVQQQQQQQPAPASTTRQIAASSSSAPPQLRPIITRSSMTRLFSAFQSPQPSPSAVATPTTPSAPDASFASHHHHHHHQHHQHLHPRQHSHLAGDDDDDMSDDEDIANLMRCCDGKHDVSRLSKHYH